MKKDKEYYIRKLAELEVHEVSDVVVRNALPVVDLLAPYGSADVEYFLCVELTSAHKVIRLREVSKGILNRTVVDPRALFRDAIKDNAAAVIIAHNHPSGDVSPSENDRDLTRRLRDAGELLGITVLDHVIVGRGGAYFSFVEGGI